MSNLGDEIEINVDDENTLVDLVCGRPWLYDKSCNEIKNKVKKENSWEEIAAIFKITVPEAIKWWDSVKKKYVKKKEDLNAATRSGSAATRTPNWAPFQKLQSMFKKNEPRISISTIENDGEPTKLQSNRQHNQKPYGRTIKTEKEVKFMADAMNSIKQTTTHIKSLITEKEKYSAEIDTNDPDTVFGMFLLAKLNEADKNTRKQIINHLHDWLKKHVSDSESSSDSEYSSEKESVSNL